MSATPDSSGSPMLTTPVEIPDHLTKPVGTPGPRLLEIERSKASFSPKDLELYLYGKDYIERRDRILPILENEVSLRSASSALAALVARPPELRR